MPVRALGYVRLGAEDIEAWRQFAGEFLGMMEVKGDNAAGLYYRMDDYPPRLVISPAPQNSVEGIGFEVTGPEELAELVSAVEQTGTKVTRLDASECRERRITEGVR